MTHMHGLAIGVAGLIGSSAFGGVVIHSTYASWASAVGGGDQKIDFDLGPAQQDLFDQYANFGVHFGGTATAAGIAFGDGWGATTVFPTFAMTVNFDSQQYGLGLDLMHPFKVALFAGGQLLYQSPQLNTFGPVFRGISTDVPFDTAVIQSIPGTTSGTLDNIYVANPIPAPASICLIAMLAGARRRRRS